MGLPTIDYSAILEREWREEERAKRDALPKEPPRKLFARDLEKRYGRTREQITATPGFPKSGGKVIRGLVNFISRDELFWFEADVIAWEEALRAVGFEHRK